MNNDLVCLSVPNFQGNERKYVDQAIDEEWVSTAGPFISQFEKNMADKMDVPQACACQSGTAGLHLCLRHFGIGDGDIVLVPTLTFIAPINTVIYQHATPVFFDCDENLCIDTQQLEEYLREQCEIREGHTVEKESGKTVKAVIPVHVFGDHCDMDKMMALAEEFGLVVIEDATEAVGGHFSKGLYAGKAVGTVGHAGVLSFNGNKIITTGGGGMVLSKDTAVIEHVRYLSQQAKNDVLFFVHDEVGYNYRMTNLQAALGLAQLEELPAFVEIKRKNYHRYCELLQNCTYASILPFASGDSSNYWFYSFALNEANPEKRDSLIHYMNDQNIQVRPIWKLNHTQKMFRQYKAMPCKKAEEYYNRVINIPCSTNLTEKQQIRVCEALMSFC